MLSQVIHRRDAKSAEGAQRKAQLRTLPIIKSLAAIYDYVGIMPLLAV
jgi:hypothetical protein